jgi:putative DNA primase/helicase
MTHLNAALALAEKGCEPIDLHDFLALNLPPHEHLLTPILPEQGIMMVHAPAGLGKTRLLLGMSYAVASGGRFLKWQAPKPRKLLYIDGELPGSAFQDMLANTVASSDSEAAPGFFKLLTPDLAPFGIPDLSTPAGQEELAAYLDDRDLIVVDNISTICRGFQENEAPSWGVVQEWAIHLRSRGKSVIFVHHSNRQGGYRGTSRMLDVLDTCCRLKRPDDYANREGARFELHFDKSRGFYGADAEPLEVQLETDAHGAQLWTMKQMQDVRAAQIIEARESGMGYREIENQLGIKRSTAQRLAKKGKKND